MTYIGQSEIVYPNFSDEDEKTAETKPWPRRKRYSG